MALLGLRIYSPELKERPSNDRCQAADFTDIRSDAGSVLPRDVRVLLQTGLEVVRVHGPARIFKDTHSLEAGLTLTVGDQVDVTLSGPSAFSIAGQTYQASSLGVREISEQGVELSFPMAADDSASLHFLGRIDLEMDGPSRIRVINHVPVEAYVAGVVSGEIWPTFHEETFRVQAILARTFVLFQMQQREQEAFDVTAGQGSQVYRGLRVDEVGRRAKQAAEYTRGVVCTYDDGRRKRLFCTYYSAACGGGSQSAAIFGPLGAVPPLAGGVPCDFCRAAPADTYRWGPTRLDKDELFKRLTARFPDLQSLIEIQSIQATSRTADGRLVNLRVMGAAGASRDLLAERFRMAAGPSIMRSTACEIRISSGEVIFENGRGFGHGMGLCQWGAEGMARSGRRASQIISYYFPGSELDRAY